MEKGKAGCTDVCELLSSKLHAVAHIAVDATVHSDATAAQVAVKEVSLLNSSQSARLAKLERLLQRVEKTRRATVAAEAQLMALKSAAQGSIWPRLEHEAEIERMLASTLPKPAAKKTEGGAARPANPASDAGSSGRFQCVQHFAELPVHLVVPDDVPSEEAKGLQEADATSEAAGQQEGRDAEGEGATFQPWQHPKPVDSKAVRESRLPPKVVTTVMTKPQGFAEKEYGLALQNFECKGCGTKLKKGLSLKRLGTSWGQRALLLLYGVLLLRRLPPHVSHECDPCAGSKFVGLCPPVCQSSRGGHVGAAIQSAALLRLCRQPAAVRTREDTERGAVHAGPAHHAARHRCAMFQIPKEVLYFATAAGSRVWPPRQSHTSANKRQQQHRCRGQCLHP